MSSNKSIKDKNILIQYAFRNEFPTNFMPEWKTGVKVSSRKWSHSPLTLFPSYLTWFSWHESLSRLIYFLLCLRKSHQNSWHLNTSSTYSSVKSIEVKNVNKHQPPIRTNQLIRYNNFWIQFYSLVSQSAVCSSNECIHTYILKHYPLHMSQVKLNKWFWKDFNPKILQTLRGKVNFYAIFHPILTSFFFSVKQRVMFPFRLWWIL